MKRIEMIDKAIEAGKATWQIDEFSQVFVAAYYYAVASENDMPNFGEIIWDHDIPDLIRDLKKYGYHEFTISSTFSGLIHTIAELEKQGCKLEGTCEIKDRYGFEDDMIPAFKMSL